MANRVLAGNRSSGGYGLYVSRPGNNVLDCANDKLMLNTNSGESGNAFFSAGHFQVVPNAGGTGGTAPTIFSSTTLSAGATATASYQNFASNKVLMWGSFGTVTTNNSADAFFFTYSGIGTTSATLTNSTAGSLTVKNIAFNLLNSAALF